ncbi:hypothetical protein [Allonocardiopsis opalescens]|uniref:MYXO-CTERM domain-containing protein n=1 Tax=Allonocardiopsis opalescens TaxID=1144618 RepID=A0A2T0Q0C1_9ACTN|nr:hypothetical protein [Allonocardiopsis opalescens]PRX97155.1 hypothetical protein CLV72_106191 [Allonocardiopsis opalescens]
MTPRSPSPGAWPVPLPEVDPAWLWAVVGMAVGVLAAVLVIRRWAGPRGEPGPPEE